MTISFTVAAKENPRINYDNVSVGDAVEYSVDFSAWEEDNDTITSVDWVVEQGGGALSTPSLASGVTACVITFSQVGNSLISVLATTATRTKKVWLNIAAHDENNLAFVDSYSPDGAG